MSTSSIIVMIIGMVTIWGGLATSIAHAVYASKKEKAKQNR